MVLQIKKPGFKLNHSRKVQEFNFHDLTLHHSHHHRLKEQDMAG